MRENPSFWNVVSEETAAFSLINISTIFSTLDHGNKNLYHSKLLFILCYYVKTIFTTYECYSNKAL